MFCQSKKKKKDEEKGVYCPIAQKTIQPPKTGLGHFLIFQSKLQSVPSHTQYFIILSPPLLSLEIKPLPDGHVVLIPQRAV